MATNGTLPSQNEGAFPALDLVQKERDRILKVKPADPEGSLALSAVSDKDVGVGINHGIRANHNAAALAEAASFFFGSDNIALPGLALYFQIDAQVERNDATLKGAFLNRRGQHPSTGPTAGFSTNDFRSGDVSDPLAAFANSLAINKIQFEKLSELYKLAAERGDASAADFVSSAVTALSYRIKAKAHYVTTLKLSASDKSAIKGLDRRIPFEIEDLAIAAGIEASVPSRLQIGTVLRAQIYQTKAFDNGKAVEHEQRARAAFNQVV